MTWQSKGKRIDIWTDGSANNATGSRGGYGIVLINGTIRQFCGGCYHNTSSARMELLAIIRGLQKCEPGHSITVYSDNQYAVNSIRMGWAFRWEQENFRQRKNKDLLKELLFEYRRLGGGKYVQLCWVKGHAGNPMNELADKLAYRGACRESIILDREITKTPSI